jgi:3-oxoacyl-[acyl-carrier-protein] synthase-3
MKRSVVLGTGSYLPDKVITNFDLEKMVETNHNWIVERTGIHRRHMAAPNQNTSDLALIASQRALEAAKLKAEDIDMILFATVTPDHIMPNTACLLQSKLGCKPIPALDINAACSGFIYALSVADQFIRNGTYKNILVIGAEVLTRIVNFKDRETCILFGDAAGAFILGASDDQNTGIYSFHLKAEGNLGDLFLQPAGGSAMPLSQEVLDTGSQYVKMKGKEIFKNAVRTMAHLCEEALTTNSLKPSDINWLIPHQANWRIMEAVADNLDFPKDKVVSIIHEMGNTSAASVPVAFDTAVRDGRIQKGQNILLTAFGAGLTSGSLVLRY